MLRMILLTVVTSGLLCLTAVAQLAAPLPTNADQTVRDENLSPEQLNLFQTQTKDLVGQFQEYLGKIADPDLPDPIRENAIENALKMFVDSASIEVGSLRSSTFVVIKRYPLENYLRRVKNLGKRYGDVKINSYSPVVVNGWEQVTKDRYRTKATFYQKFEGYKKNGQLRYADKTAKDVDVNLNFINNPYYLERRWLILLGDVTVREVQPTR